MPHPHADVIDGYWAERFGCSRDELQSLGWHLIVSEEADPCRIAVLELAQGTLIRSAEEHAELLAAWIKSQPEDAPRTAQSLAGTFSPEAYQVSPSEKVFYLNPAEFRPFAKPEVRQLSEADSHDLTAMHHGCSLEEQKAGEVCIDHPAIFGAYVNGQLAAAASLIDQGAGISDVGVLVHRDFRRQGYGKAAVSALAAWGLEHGRIVQYWRLCENVGSARIAESLGFSEYGQYQLLHLTYSPFG